MFQQCEKLMDKGMFKNEYSKEINKKKYRTKKLWIYKSFLNII